MRASLHTISYLYFTINSQATWWIQDRQLKISKTQHLHCVTQINGRTYVGNNQTGRNEGKSFIFASGSITSLWGFFFFLLANQYRVVHDCEVEVKTFCTKINGKCVLCIVFMPDRSIIYRIFHCNYDCKPFFSLPALKIQTVRNWNCLPMFSLQNSSLSQIGEKESMNC